MGWEFLRDRWEYDSVFREQIVLAVIVGAIGLSFVLLEIAAKRHWLGGDPDGS